MAPLALALALASFSSFLKGGGLGLVPGFAHGLHQFGGGSGGRIMFNFDTVGIEMHFGSSDALYALQRLLDFGYTRWAGQVLTSE